MAGMAYPGVHAVRDGMGRFEPRSGTESVIVLALHRSMFSCVASATAACWACACSRNNLLCSFARLFSCVLCCAVLCCSPTGSYHGR